MTTSFSSFLFYHHICYISNVTAKVLVLFQEYIQTDVNYKEGNHEKHWSTMDFTGFYTNRHPDWV